jgi:hypothetical protein
MRKLLVPSLLAAAMVTSTEGGASGDTSWTQDFAIDREDLASVGRNPYFVLEPGYKLVLGSGSEELTITVLEETRKIGDVETRIVEERETKDGRLIEVSRNYYAISRRTNSVFYFGEEVDMYKGGKVDNHEGSWLAGTNGARAGLMMPGLPLLGAKYQQEVAPGVAMDRGEIASMSDSVTTPAGAFKNVLRVAESTPLEPLLHEKKQYAAGIGLVQDGSMKLVRYGKN